MTEELIVKHCSPTLAGLKTANMFSCPCSDKEALLYEIRKINKCLESKMHRIRKQQRHARNLEWHWCNKRKK